MSLESCGLLNLPREIRDMIYVHVMNLNSPDPTAYDVLVGFWGSPGSTKRPSKAFPYPFIISPPVPSYASTFPQNVDLIQSRLPPCNLRRE